MVCVPVPQPLIWPTLRPPASMCWLAESALRMSSLARASRSANGITFCRWPS